MAVLANRAGMDTSTTGTGTITLGSNVENYQTFADANVADGAVVSYLIVDGSAWEIGRGTYTASGTTLSRTVLESTNSDSAINLSGSAQVYITALAEDHEVITATSISFDGGTNTLAKYEGTTSWTPEIADAATGGNTATYGGRGGFYTRVGPKVHIEFQLLNVDTTGMTSGNDLRLRNLPYAVATGSGYRATNGVIMFAVTLASSPIAYAANGDVSLRFWQPSSFLTVSALTSGSADIYGSLDYITDAA